MLGNLLIFVVIAGILAYIFVVGLSRELDMLYLSTLFVVFVFTNAPLVTFNETAVGFYQELGWTLERESCKQSAPTPIYDSDGKQVGQTTSEECSWSTVDSEVFTFSGKNNTHPENPFRNVWHPYRTTKVTRNRTNVRASDSSNRKIYPISNHIGNIGDTCVTKRPIFGFRLEAICSNKGNR